MLSQRTAGLRRPRAPEGRGLRAQLGSAPGAGPHTVDPGLVAGAEGGWTTSWVLGAPGPPSTGGGDGMGAGRGLALSCPRHCCPHSVAHHTPPSVVLLEQTCLFGFVFL